MVSNKYYIQSKKGALNVRIVLFVCNAYCMFLLTIKFFQVCEMPAAPCYICVIDIGVNIGIAKSW